MKAFKRLACFAFALLLLFAMIPARAASNSDAIISALKSGVVVNGHQVNIPASYINQAENYLAAHKLTDEQVTYIVGQINAAKASIRKAGVTDLHKIDPATKQEILSDATAAANKAALKLTVGSDKKVKIADSKGAVAFSDENPIKTTGADINLVPFFASLTVLGLVAVLCIAGIVKQGLLKRKDT